MIYPKSFYLNKNVILWSIFTLNAFLVPLKLASQTVGLKVSEKVPPQYFSEKKRFHALENQYFVKNVMLRPSKIPSVFSIETLPFFCKIEYKMSLQKKLPLKFRLGDVQYVDEMERKRNN